MTTITWGWRHAKMVYWKMSKVKNEMFSSHTISPFPSPLPGKRARTHRDMLIIEFSSQKECSKIRVKAWPVFFLVCWTLHRSRISLSFKKIRYSASQCYSVHVVYSARNVFVAQHKRSNFSIWALWNVWYYSIYRSNVSIRSFIIQLLGTWHLCRPGGREFDDQSLPGDGEIDPNAWGNILFFVANWLRSKRYT